MNLDKRKQFIISLGEVFRSISDNEKQLDFPGYDKIYYHNPWFTPEFVRYCIKNWGDILTKERIYEWTSKYPKIAQNNSDKCIALIFAGNIPLVGLHDLICSLLAGLKTKIKSSSKDQILTSWIIKILTKIHPELKLRISLTEGKLDDFNAVIATGSNNSNRYFEYYFGKYPNILRTHKNSTAVLTGKETANELSQLADDIFLYFGFGCRSVSHIYVPDNYDFEKIIKAFDKYSNLSYHNKFANNIDYQYAISQLNKIKTIHAGNAILIKNASYSSPVGVLHYSYYSEIDKLKNEIVHKENKLQCVITSDCDFIKQTYFGKSQQPELDDYADGVDTLDFLIKLTNNDI